MIRALLLLFDPVRTWERIIEDQPGKGIVLGVQLMPLLLLSALAEGLALTHFGRPRGVSGAIHHFPAGEGVVFETVQLLIWIIIVFVLAKLVKSVADTFHGRHTFSEALTAVVYSLGPFFLLKAVGAFIPVSPWIVWFVAIFFALGALYNGLPRVLKPDPPTAFGLYVISAILMFLTTGLVTWILTFYINGKFPDLEAQFIALGSRLPF
jgi:hypothetical protein